MHKKRWDIQPHEVERIETMAAMGLNRDAIARIMGVSHDTLERALKKNDKARASMQRGRDVADFNVAQKAYEMSLSGKHPTMTQFWLRCRAGWKEQHDPQTPIQINIGDRTEKLVSELDGDKLLKLMLQLKNLPPEERCNLAQTLSPPSQESLAPSSQQQSDGES